MVVIIFFSDGRILEISRIPPLFFFFFFNKIIYFFDRLIDVARHIVCRRIKLNMSRNYCFITLGDILMYNSIKPSEKRGNIFEVKY